MGWCEAGGADGTMVGTVGMAEQYESAVQQQAYKLLTAYGAAELEMRLNLLRSDFGVWSSEL